MRQKKPSGVRSGVRMGNVGKTSFRALEAKFERFFKKYIKIDMLYRKNKKSLYIFCLILSSYKKV